MGDFTFWTNTATIASCVIGGLSLVVTIISLQSAPPSKATSSFMEVQIVKRVEYVRERKKHSNGGGFNPTTGEPILDGIMVLVVLAAIAFFFCKHLEQIQIYVLFVSSTMFLFTTLLFWYVRTRDVYELYSNANILLINSSLTWFVGLLAFSPFNISAIRSVQHLAKWSDLFQNLTNPSWLAIGFNGLGVILYSLLIVLFFIKLVGTIAILSNASSINKLYREMRWPVAIIYWSMLALSGFLMHGYATPLLNHIYPFTMSVPLIHITSR